MIAIIDYGMGNVASVQKALNFLKLKSVITDNFDEIRNADSIILPGVGSFTQGMANLRAKKLDTLLNEEVIEKKKKFLGICLGMQLIFEEGSEPARCAGLGWIQGKVVKIESDLRIPHMGWNNLNVKNETYLSGLDNKDVYFIHSYHAVPKDPEVIAATVTYGSELLASVQKDNIFATQYHPEKSQFIGLQILRNFYNA